MIWRRCGSNWRRWGAIGTAVALLTSTSLTGLSATAASAATVTVSTMPTSLLGSYTSQTYTSQSTGAQTPLTAMSATLWDINQNLIYVNGVPTQQFGPLSGYTVYFSVEAADGVWWPLCTAVTDASGIASCASKNPAIIVNGVPTYQTLSAWSAVYQGNSADSPASDYGRIPGSPTPAPTPPDNDQIAIQPSTYVAGCQPPSPQDEATLGDLLTDGGNCQLEKIESVLVTVVFGLTSAVITGGAEITTEIISDSLLAEAQATQDIGNLAAAIAGNEQATGTAISAGASAIPQNILTVGSTVYGGALSTLGEVDNSGNVTINNDQALNVGAGTTLVNSGVIDNSGTLGDGTVSNEGAGVIDNTGTIINDGSIAGNGLGSGRLLITGNNYILDFDANGGPGAAPAPLQVLSDSAFASQQSLPNATPPSGEQFVGWFTSAEGDTQVSEQTDLSALFGPGPVTVTLYAHYAPIRQTTLYVSPAGSSTSCAGTGAAACPTIADAITAATSGAYSGQNVAINVASGNYDETDTIAASGLASLTINGAGSSGTTVDAGGLGSVFTVNSGSVTISNLTITNGSNAAGEGGGGVYDDGGAVTLTDDTVSADHAPGGIGGGVSVFAGSLTATDDTFVGDTAALGGAIDNNDQPVTLTNDTFFGDSATDDGGGIYTFGGPVSLLDDTLSNDSAPTGGGLAVDAVQPGPVTTVADSIFDGAGCATFGSGTISDAGYNVESDDSCGFGSTSVVDSSTIDLAGSLATNGSDGPETLAIATNSSAFAEVPPAYAAAPGTDGCSVAIDERFANRPGDPGGNCDAGAYETEGTATTTTVLFDEERSYSFVPSSVELYSSVSTTSGGPVNEGTVTFTIEQDGTSIGTPVTAQVSDGNANASYPLPAELAEGNYAIEATYTDSTGQFAGSSDLSQDHYVTIIPPPTTTSGTDVSVQESDAAQGVDLSAVVYSLSGQVNEGSVLFSVLDADGNVVGSPVEGSVSDSQASAEYELPAGLLGGAYTVVADYADYGGVFPSSSDNTHTLVVNSPTAAPPASVPEAPTAGALGIVGAAVVIAAYLRRRLRRRG